MKVRDMTLGQMASECIEGCCDECGLSKEKMGTEIFCMIVAAFANDNDDIDSTLLDLEVDLLANV